MKTIIKTAVLSICAGLLFILDIPAKFPLEVGFVPEAQAIFGVRRRALRRGVIIGSSMAATDAAAHSSAAVQAQPAAAPPPPPPPPAPVAATPPPPPAAGGKSLPMGTVVNSLPTGCKEKPVGGIEYYHCGGNYYRAVFQGNNLVYVTAKP